jgi:hypothetical protein
LREELRSTAIEPLLPIEKKLIAWSLGIGLLLLIVLAAISTSIRRGRDQLLLPR